MFGLQKEPLALPKVLLSVHWNDASQVDEAHRLLFKWRRMSPLAALELLDAKFPDPVVRAGGRSCVMIPQRRVLTNSLVCRSAPMPCLAWKASVTATCSCTCCS